MRMVNYYKIIFIHGGDFFVSWKSAPLTSQGDLCFTDIYKEYF